MSRAYPITITTEASSLHPNAVSNCKDTNEISLDLKKDEPFAHLMAALGTCMEMNASSVAAKTGFEVLGIKIQSTPEVKDNTLISIHVEATYEVSDSMTEKDAKNFFDAVEENCFMSQFLLDADIKFTHKIHLSLDPIA